MYKYVEFWGMRKNLILDMLKESPNDPFLHFALAKEYEKEEDWSQAVNSYKWIHKNQVDYVGMYYHLALALIELDSPAEEIKAIYEEGIKIATDQGDQHAKAELQNAFLNWEMEL